MNKINSAIIPLNSTVIIGLSGGPDSVFLTHYLSSIAAEKKLTLIAAHLDHEWRSTSYKDVEFCQQLCQQLNIPLVVEQASHLPASIQHNGSKEEIGRDMRRYFLESVAQKFKAQAIVLGHHFNDQEETFFIRLIRGTTLDGLVGMQPQSGLYIRPLLSLTKEEILTYLHEHHLSYIIDPSNESPDFLRNRVRTTVLPALRACDERFDMNFKRTLENLTDANDFITQQTLLTYQTISRTHDEHLNLDLKQLFQLHPYLQRCIIIHWLIEHGVHFTPTRKFIDEIYRFLESPRGGTHHMHTTWAIHKKQQFAYITVQ